MGDDVAAVVLTYLSWIILVTVSEQMIKEIPKDP